MSIQLMLPFKDVPVICPIQAKYHTIAPCWLKPHERENSSIGFLISYLFL